MAQDAAPVTADPAPIVQDAPLPAEPTTATQTEAAAADDAEISFVTRDLAPLLQRARIVGTVSAEEVTARVREAANWIGRNTGPALASAATSGKLAYAVDGAPDPYAGFETRIVPENITLLPKAASHGNKSWYSR